MKRGLSMAGALVLALGFAGAAQAAPAEDGPRETARSKSSAVGNRVPVGNDVSWPQCGEALPVAPAFAIVGVNGGLANTTNPCFVEQLAWAESATAGGTNQPDVALYVNTANPGHAGSWWPTSNYYPTLAASPVPNPYGECTGENGAACAYIYGYAKAFDNATIRGVPDPASYFWWLDVETMNTWQADTTANRAALEGMTYYYTDVLDAVGVGIYSTGYQWTQIVGSVGPVTSGTVVTGPSNLNGLPSWLAGATTLKGAQRNCERAPLTGGQVTLTQYVSGDLDYNYSCV